MEKNQLEDLAIAWYNYDDNKLEILDTMYHSESQSISANITHFSTYFVVNLRTYHYDIDWVNSGNITGKADVVFVIDTTGSMSGAIQNVRNNVSQFIAELKENHVDVRLGLVEYRDLYTDGTGSTKSYDWYTDVKDFQRQLASLGVSGGGDIPESAVDGLHCAENMSFRSGVNKYIILVTDANSKSGITGNSSFTMEQEIENLVRKKIVTSVVTTSMYKTAYSNLTVSTDGVIGDIYNNFADELKPLINKMVETSKDSYWVRLSNGSCVSLDKNPSLGDETVDSDGDGIPDLIELKEYYQVTLPISYLNTSVSLEFWSFESNPDKVDTDGDGIEDIDDLSPSKYDTVIIENNDEIIKFNTGRIWYNIPCTSFDYLDNLLVCIDGLTDNPIPLEKFQTIVYHMGLNEDQEFSIDELTVIGLLNNEGSKLYMNNSSSKTRETVFTELTSRESDYYKHSGIFWWESWSKVPNGTEGGFFKGAVLSEADINFSTKIFYICDVFTVLESVATVGAIVIAVIVMLKATPVILANLQGAIYYIKTFGVKEGFKMYQYLGVQNLPNSVITWIQWDVADGDSSLDDLIGANIPVYQRGITGEKILHSTYGGESQKYFKTYVNGIHGGRYIDQFAQNIAHESKVGYTCLSNRIRMQILKDAYLIQNDAVSEVVWHFFRSDITGKVGATQSVLNFLTENGIQYIIH